MEFGMPTLIEIYDLEESAKLCKELGLKFIELNMTFPQYQIAQMEETAYLQEIADKYAEDMLIPPEQYQNFIRNNKFDIQAIKNFATEINRDPGIVLGRLQNDKKVGFDDWTLKPLRHKYKVKVSR